METKTIAKINNQLIVVIEESDKNKLVPIKPICDALGIDSKAQRNKIERDEILSSVKVITTSTGADGKQYEMFCLPLKFIFGWLFTIDTSRVNEGAREAVVNYKLKCYNVLYDYFSEYSEFVEVRAKAMEKHLSIYQDLQKQFNEARFSMEEAKKKLNLAREVTFDKYKSDKDQFILEFIETDSVDNSLLNDKEEK